MLKKEGLTRFDPLDEHTRVDTLEELFGTKPTWLIEIEDEELAGAGLHSGDRVAVSNERTPREGDQVWTISADRVEVKPHREGSGEEIAGVTIGIVRRSAQATQD